MDDELRERRRTREQLAKKVALKQRRKQRARDQQAHTVWFGLGMFGLVGWSVALPTLAGVALGAWIDSRWPSRYSWTLMLMISGVAMGCLNAWRWVQRESRESNEDEGHDNP